MICLFSYCCSVLRWGLSVAWTSPSRLGWLPEEHQEPCVSYSSVQGLQACATIPAFCFVLFIWVMGIKLVSSCCKASTFLTEPSPQPPTCLDRSRDRTMPTKRIHVHTIRSHPCLSHEPYRSLLTSSLPVFLLRP